MSGGSARLPGIFAKFLAPLRWSQRRLPRRLRAAVFRGARCRLVFSHEEGFFFMAQSLGHFRAMCAAEEKGDARARGRALQMKAAANVENSYTRAFQEAQATLAQL